MYSLESKKKRRKIIEIIGISIVLIWAIIFLIDYIRFESSKHPLIVFNTQTTKFSDGMVKEYISLGYVYREYNRRSIGDTELTPIWKKMQRPESIDDYPVTYKNYNIPENLNMNIKYKGLIYFYNNSDLVGTYKCINTKSDCSPAVSGNDKYNIQAIDALNSLIEQPFFYIFDKNYAFIDDSYEQANANKNQYKRTIYLFNAKKNKIIAQYADIKYSVVNEAGSYADGANNNFIVMNSNKKWGIVNIKDGKIKEVLPFEYESINYSLTTGYYIVKKGDWYVLKDLKTKELTTAFKEPIINVIKYKNNLIIETATLIEKNKYSYKLSLDNGTEILNDSNIIQITLHENFITYVTSDLNLFITDYENNKLITDQIKLYFSTFAATKDTLGAYEITVLTDFEQIKISVPRAKELLSTYDVYYYDLTTWLLVDKQTGVANN